MTSIDLVKARIARREAEWSWANLDPEIRTRFTGRLANLLPELDPEVEWSNANPLPAGNRVASDDRIPGVAERLGRRRSPNR